MLYEYRKDQHFLSRRRRVFVRRIRKILFLSIIIFLAFIFLTFFAFKNKNSKTTIISPLAGTFGTSVRAVSNFFNSSRLNGVVKKSLAGTQGKYAVVIKNLKTNESYSQNENKQFEAASLYKLWVMATVYESVEKGKLDFDKKIEKDIKDLNKEFEIATESAELIEGTVSLTVKSAIRQMIVISHNYAALALTQEVGLSNVSNFLKLHGLANSKTGSPPMVSAFDIALFYEKLYKGEFASKKSTDEMLDVLKDQQLNDRIPKYLPPEVKVAHKTGEIAYFKHDAGIVFANNDYIIVVLSESESPQAASERIALLSKEVYEYFEKK